MKVLGDRTDLHKEEVEAQGHSISAGVSRVESVNGSRQGRFHSGLDLEKGIERGSYRSCSQAPNGRLCRVAVTDFGDFLGAKRKVVQSCGY